MTKCGEPHLFLTFDDVMKVIDHVGSDFEWTKRVTQRPSAKPYGQEGFSSRDVLNPIGGLRSTQLKKSTDKEDFLPGERSAPALSSVWYFGTGCHDFHRYQQKSPSLTWSIKSAGALCSRHLKLSQLDLWYLLRLAHDHSRCHG